MANLQMLGGMASHMYDITPDDNNDLSSPCYGIFVGATGDLRVLGRLGGDVTYKNIPDGTFLPISVSRVMQTGTTASSIIGHGA